MHTSVTVNDMTVEGWDMNEEYEKIFGSAKRINLFDTEEKYNELRQFIIDQPQITYISDKLPFDGIENDVKKKQANQDEQTAIEKDVKKELSRLIKSLIDFSTHKVSRRHLFYIKEKGVCNASGYLDEENNFFYICKNSLVSYETDIFYMVSDKEKARQTFLNKICIEEVGYYRVLKDAKCRSASAAASYVLGHLADFVSWKDDHGRTLSEIYPNICFIPVSKKQGTSPKEALQKMKETPEKGGNTQNKVNPPKVGRPPRYYYISRDMGNRSCCAKGMYDKENNKFIIMEGSTLAYEVTSSFRYTASDIKRKKFIQLNCEGKYENKLKRNAICNSPDEAACFVLGENADGWLVWKSKNGISLESYISKV